MPYKKDPKKQLGTDMDPYFPHLAWMKYFRQLSHRFQVLNQQTETTFLEIGRRLQTYHKQALRISEKCAAVVECMYGEAISGACQRFNLLLEEMRLFMKGSEDELDRSQRNLQKVDQILRKLRNPLLEFQKVVRILNVLGISTKIESARLIKMNKDFNTLADNVTKLASLISTKSANIIERAESLINSIDDTYQKTTLFRNKQSSQRKEVIEDTQVRLNGFIEKKQQLEDRTRKIFKNSEDISRSIGEVVVSIQFHDITRQKIEHTDQVLTELEGVLRRNSGFIEQQFKKRDMAELSESFEKTIGQVAEACSLQVAQLSSTQKQFTNAIKGINRHLGIIRNGIGMMVADCLEVVGMSDGGYKTFLSEIEGGLYTTASEFSEYTNANSQLSSAIASVSDEVSRIAVFVKDIENIGNEINEIALNARIKAAHTGRQGGPLGVLAETIQQLSNDAYESSQAITSALQEIDGIAGELKINASLELEGESVEVNTFVGLLKSALETIRNADEKTLGILEEIQEDSGHLAREIKEAALTERLLKYFSREINGTMYELNHIAKKAASFLPETYPLRGKNFSQALDNLSNNYTMESEREVHENFLRNVEKKDGAYPEPHSVENNEAQKNTPDNGTGDEAELSDNVELF